MIKKKSILIIFIIFIFNISFFQRVHAENLNNRIVKVGLFCIEPYAYESPNGDLQGYYIDMFNLISKKMNLEVQYIMYNSEEWLPSLENREVDILLGASITNERSQKFIFNKYSIALENYALYTNRTDLDLSNFENLNGLKFGYIEESAKKDWILDFFKSINVSIVPVIGENYSELDELMSNGNIDLIMDSAYINNNHRKIYEFLGDQVYIMSNKENQDLLDEIDNVIFNYGDKNTNLIAKLYRSYFDIEKNEINKKINLLISIIIIILMSIFLRFIIPSLKKNIVKGKIYKRLKDNKYLLYYQPIHNSINGEIVGFEGLLRLRDKSGNLISPAKFIPEIEKNDMLFDITLWIIKKAVLDYKKIKRFNCIDNNDFYISINLSIDEIKNNRFVEKAIEILNDSNLEKNNICLEIIERVKADDLDKIISNIAKLKEAGFKLAIDDFGVEYSNLDILEKLDADIIKVDKNYVDGLGKDLLKDETILFILKVASAEDKIVILEGVEEKEQDIKIKNFKNNKLLVQGYFYNKPMSIKSIESL